MPAITTSAARVAANRLNAQKSTGPKTERGKERSRANAVKHGLTGAGIALPVEDAVEVEHRFLAIQGELAPQTVVGAFLAHQVALMTVRCQRAARQESAALATKIRRAAGDFDEARNAEADLILGWIESEPVANRRKLLAMPEGVDRLVRVLIDLKSELDKPSVVWTYVHRQKIEAYFGRRECDVPPSRGVIITQAIGGDFAELDPSEGAGLSPLERRNWAADRLIEYIDEEVARLQEHRATLDLEAIALDRAEAGDRAMFDPGKEATLARKYEAAASRALYRALRELREVEATGAGEAAEPVAAEVAVLEAGDAVPAIERESAEWDDEPFQDHHLGENLGSFGTGADADPAPSRGSRTVKNLSHG